MRRRPAKPDPAVLAEQPLPRAAYLEALVLAPRTASTTELGELIDEVRREPVTHLGAERLIRLGEPHVHIATVVDLKARQKRGVQEAT
jgi:hypothetical protein